MWCCTKIDKYEVWWLVRWHPWDDNGQLVALLLLGTSWVGTKFPHETNQQSNAIERNSDPPYPSLLGMMYFSKAIVDGFKTNSFILFLSLLFSRVWWHLWDNWWAVADSFNQGQEAKGEIPKMRISRNIWDHLTSLVSMIFVLIILNR